MEAYARRRTRLYGTSYAAYRPSKPFMQAFSRYGKVLPTSLSCSRGLSVPSAHRAVERSEIRSVKLLCSQSQTHSNTSREQLSTVARLDDAAKLCGLDVESVASYQALHFVELQQRPRALCSRLGKLFSLSSSFLPLVRFEYGRLACSRSCELSGHSATSSFAYPLGCTAKVNGTRCVEELPSRCGADFEVQVRPLMPRNPSRCSRYATAQSLYRLEGPERTYNEV